MDNNHINMFICAYSQASYVLIKDGKNYHINMFICAYSQVYYILTKAWNVSNDMSADMEYVSRVSVLEEWLKIDKDITLLCN